MATRKILDKETINLAGQKNFKDLSVLSKFVKMERLYLDETAVEDLSPLVDCNQLKVLRPYGVICEGYLRGIKSYSAYGITNTAYTS